MNPIERPILKAFVAVGDAHVVIPPDGWWETGPDSNPKARLLASITINGCAMHVEAYQVRDRDGEQRIADPYFKDEFEAIYGIDGEGKKTAVRIGRRDYLIIVFPHQE